MTALEDQRKHAWDYFALHAQQRLTTFNFFLILSSLLLGGLVTTFQKEFRVPHVGVPIGLFLILLAFTFWKLDTRNKQLIKNAEDGLRSLEELWREKGHSEPPRYAVFLRDAAYVSRARSRGSWRFWKSHLSYSDCFNLTYIAVAVSGLVGAIGALLY